MKLHGRDLAAAMTGTDVVLVQYELVKLGYDLPPTERDESRFGPGTVQAVRSFQEAHELPVTGVVDEATAAAITAALEERDLTATYVVAGVVRDSDGAPLAGRTVRVFEVDLRAEEALGEAAVGDDGTYHFAYRPGRTPRGAGRGPDVRVALVDGEEREILSSPTYVNVAPYQVIDLALEGGARGRSEYEELREEIEARIGKVPIHELTEEEERQQEERQQENAQPRHDISHLAAAADRDPRAVAFLVLAHRLAHRTRLPAEVFFGLLRQDLPTTLHELAAQSPDVLARALEEAAERNVVPRRVMERVDATIARLREEAVAVSLEDRPVGERPSLGMLLEPVLPDARVRESFLQSYAQHTGNIQDFWHELRRDESMAARVPEIQLGIQLNALTANHRPLVEVLLRMKNESAIDSFADLAGFSQDDWVRILQRESGEQPIGVPPGVPGSNDRERLRNYVRLLTETAFDAHPTVALSRGLAESEIEGKADLLQFFEDNPSFDLRHHPLAQVLADEPEALRNVQDRGHLTRQIEGFQRLSHVATRFDQMTALLDAGFDSAHGIASMERHAFAVGHGAAVGGTRDAERIHDRATSRAAFAQSFLVGHGLQNMRVSLEMLPDPVLWTVEGQPDWASMFGSLDLCACQHCKSIYGPAAYFVDILEFLKNRQRGPTNKTPKHVLFERRPDLGAIELSCENTNTPIPYVDLVNEILEATIASNTPFASFSLSTAHAADLDQAQLTEALRAAFDQAGHKLTVRAELTAHTPGERWYLDDRAFRYSLRQQNGQLTVSPGHQTRGTSQERAAGPQYEIQAAYDKLRSAVYPWILPFDLGLEEVRAYLTHLGKKRHEVMATFLPDPRDPSVAVEILGLSQAEVEALVTGGSNAAPPAWKAWGFAVQPADLPAVVRGPLDEFLRRTGLSYAELLALLECSWVNPAGASGERKIRIRPIGGGEDDTCKLEKLELDGFDQQAAERIPDFVRLWRKLGWTMRELDVAARGFALAGFDAAALGQLADVRRLQVALRLPVDVLVSFWAEIDGDVYHDFADSMHPEVPSLFDRLFPDGALTVGAGLLTDHVGALAAAFGWRGEELLLLVPEVATSAPDPADASKKVYPLTSDNLSRVHRHVAFARSLELPVREYLSVLELAGVNVFADTATTARLVKRVARVREAGFSIAELAYLLGDRFETFSSVAPGDDVIAAVLEEIRAGLQEISDQNTVVEDPADPRGLTLDPAGEQVRQKLALFGWEPGDIDRSIAILGGTEPVDPPAAPWPEGVERPRGFLRRRFRRFSRSEYVAPLASLPANVAFPDHVKGRIRHDAQLGQLQFLGVMSEAQRLTLWRLHPEQNPPTPYHVALQSLFEQPETLPPSPGDAFLTISPGGAASDDVAALFDQGLEPAERFLFVLKALSKGARRMLGERFVTERLADALELDVEMSEALSGRLLRVPGTQDPAIEAFVAESSELHERPIGPVTKAEFAVSFSTFVMLHKAALAATRVRLDTKEMEWLFAGGPTGFDANSLPPAPSATSPSARFDAWMRFLDLVAVRDALPLGGDLLRSLFALANESATTVEDLLTFLSERTRWSLEALEVLAGPNGFAFQVADFGNERALRRLVGCSAVMSRLGMTADQCLALVANPVGAEEAGFARDAARAKHDESRWHEVARPIRDVVREKQRAALLAFLLRRPGSPWKDANELYAHLLIDVEMSPCQMTSRIKQAISSAQLFTQRCLMNLEHEVSANDEKDRGWRWWGWMKTYRVWEANRKVFLYPENWIEPELRDDKTPFFQELEDELLQGELTDEAAERAFVGYLQKLDAVARLEVVAVHHEQEFDDPFGKPVVEVLHVVGRTRSKPHAYYYRRREENVWTPWEAVDLDIEGDHLMLVVWNRRIHLLWPVFKLEAFEQSVVMPGEGKKLDDPPRYWRVQLAWSRLESDGWVARRLSRSHAKTVISESPKSGDLRDHFHGDNLNEYVFRAFVADDHNLVARLYRVNGSRDAEAFVQFVFRGCGADPTLQELYQFVGIKPGLSLQTQPPVLMGPKGSEIRGMMYVETADAGDDLFLRVAGQDSVALQRTPDTYVLQATAQDIVGGSSEPIRPLFFQDEQRTFLIEPEMVQVPTLADVELLDPWGHLEIRPKVELEKPKFEIPDPVGPRVTPGDPPRFQPSIPAAVASAPMSGFEAMVVGTGPSVVRGGGARRAMRTRYASLDLHAMMMDSTGSSSVLGIYRSEMHYRFSVFRHPHVCTFLRETNRHGVDGLLQRALQVAPRHFDPILPNGFNFDAEYDPTEIVIQPYPVEDVDFLESGAYAQYNWELFFHVPLLIADRLSKNQRFAEAQRWFHFVFDPTDRSALPPAQRYWKTKPLHEITKQGYEAQQIQTLLELVAKGGTASWSTLSHEERERLRETETAIRQWRKHPFQPHRVARTRLAAYAKHVVMKYLDNLIAWADHLFRRDSMESINEATQLYVLAANLLGRRPEQIPPREVPRIESYDTLESMLDAFSNALVAAESAVPAAGDPPPEPDAEEPPVTMPGLLYFCVPRNEQLLRYWDTVEDRLFKIRHCMNIEGVVRQLPLFEPPIDPALLVRATAAGVDLSSVLDDLSAPLPHYRFQVMAQKATELCGEVRALAGALLAAFEKKDAEEFSQLRSRHEVELHEAVLRVRKRQLEEAREILEGLKRGRAVVRERHAYYANIAYMNPRETSYQNLTEQSMSLRSTQAILNALANQVGLIPDSKVGSPTTMGVTLGGSLISGALRSMAMSIGSAADELSTRASVSATLGSYDRRYDDWKLNERLAEKEIEQIDANIAAAEVRVAIAENELENQERQIESSKEVDRFLRRKFTNQALFGWMVGQLSSVYFQSYQLAYDVAKRAERAYRHELGRGDSDFIRFGYWDSLKKGLLAGDKLHHDLKRMEVSYLESNRREYETTKHVSLAALDPLALLQLRETGACHVSIPEPLFDLDYPGHYLRRIKSVRVTIPCVTGPHTGVSCTLTLLWSSVRTSTTASAAVQYTRQESDARFRDQVGLVQSIVTSSGQNDSGLFEPGLRDDRYLPFEGAGVISDWRIELPGRKQFDHDTITDVVLHIDYTAREGGTVLRDEAEKALPTGGSRLFSVRHDFPDVWHEFMDATGPAGQQGLRLALDRNRFPFAAGEDLSVDRVDMLWKVQSGSNALDNLVFSVEDPTVEEEDWETNPPDKKFGLLNHVAEWKVDIPGEWTTRAWLQAGETAPIQAFDPSVVEDIWVICRFGVGPVL